ncbi:MAG: FHA domain-containing protein [Pseudomonadota bacterium]
MKSIARIKSFIGELKRRKVFHVGSIYLVTAWGSSLGAAELFPAFGVPDWGVRAFVIAAALGLPIALVLAWAFEITPEGVIVDPGVKPRHDKREEAPPLPVAGSNTTLLQVASVRASWSGPGGQHSQDFNNTFIIGRDADAQVRLADNKVSRAHARVYFDTGSWWIADLSSRNGTIVNGRQITEPTRLQDLNEIQVFDGAPYITLDVLRKADETVLHTVD